MKVTAISGGFLATNCYLVTDEATGCTCVIDPGFESDELMQKIEEVGCNHITAILLTHGHFDHIAGVENIKKITNAKLYIHREDAPFLSDSTLNLAKQISSVTLNPLIADVVLSDGDIVSVGNIEFSVMHTPGHTKGSCCYITKNAIFSGDTIMNCCVGRTDFPTGSYSDLLESLKKIQHLQDNYQIYPGHGSASNLEFEKENNPYLRNCAYDFDY